MSIKRLPIVAITVLTAMIMPGVILSSALNTRASSPSFNQPPTHNHPGIHYTDGAPAIPPHKDGTLLTTADVQQYVYAHQFPAGPIVEGVQLKIETLQLMTSQEASIQMRGEYIGLSNNARVYYVVVKGPFLMTNILSVTSMKGSQTFNLGEEAFDGQTGNLLVWGIRG